MQQETAVATRQPINIDFSQGIVPRSYAEVMQLAALLYKSRLAPKSLDSIEKLAISIMMCVELGRPVATGIQDLAVINGKCSIYGDAALAMVRASGFLEKFKEWETGTPYTPEWTFHCMMKRKGYDPTEGTWSWQDSVRAGHDKIGLPSPWAKYTRRMMQFKARNFIMRDEFGDVLKGIKTQEEAYDSIDMEPHENGSWGYPDPKPQVKQKEPGVAGPEPTFEDVIIKPSGLQAKVVNEFIALTAKGNDMQADAVQVEAMKNPEGFMKALQQWAKTPVDTEPVPAPQEQAPEERGKDQPAADDAPTDPIRAEFVHLRANFSTWFHKNKARIETFSAEIQGEIQAKWERMYPDNPYPLNERSADKEAAPNAEPPVVNGSGNVWCPESDGWKPVAVCEKCGKAEKCQKYQEWIFENANATD